MDGRISDDITIYPDMMQAYNPLLIVILIPAFNYGLYPILHKCHLLRKPLQKMNFGIFLNATALVLCVIVEVFVEVRKWFLISNLQYSLKNFQKFLKK